MRKSMYVCVSERERKGERDKQTDRDTEREREGGPFFVNLFNF